MNKLIIKEISQYVLGCVLFLLINFLTLKFIIPPFANNISISSLLIYFILSIINLSAIYLIRKVNSRLTTGYILAFPAFALFIAIVIVELLIHPPEE